MASEIDRLIGTIARLRAPDGCPWDREQTHDTLARYLLEEAYEVLEAIHAGDPEKLKEELGDLLLQIVLNAQIAGEAGHFDFEDVARSINEKMIKRHPHVFGDVGLDTADQVVQQWHELKEKERESAQNGSGESAQRVSALDGIPRVLPALMQALKVSERAVAQGFEWGSQGEVWEKLGSELTELMEEIARSGSADNRRELDLELGDVLFVMVNIARWNNLNPEESLLLATEKFKERFAAMEKASARPLKELSKSDFAELWEKAKLDLSNR